VKIRSWDDTIGFLFVAVPSGIAAFVFTSSCHPFPDSFASSLGFVLFSDFWLAIFCYSAFRVLSFRTVEITPDGVKEDLRFLGWPVRSRSVSFQKPHFIDLKDYRGGFPVARERTWFLFVGPGCQIAVDVEKARASQIRQIVPLGAV
jgi:hypothetical protein